MFAKSSKLARLLYLLCIYICINSCPVVFAESSNDVSVIFKAFLNTNYSDYECVYSIEQDTNPPIQQWLNQINAKAGYKRMEVIFDKPLYYLFRRSQTGYLRIRGDVLSDISSSNALNCIMLGANAKSSWSLLNNSMVFDDGKMSDLVKNKGETWEEMADAAIGFTKSLGLLIQNGSVKWNGDNFTAETANYPPISSDIRKKQIVTGRLLTSNGVPYEIDYEYNSNRFEVLYDYSDPVQGIMIPGAIKILEHFAGGYNTSYKLKIQSFRINSFQFKDTDINKLLQENNNSLTVLHKSVKGQMQMEQFRGKNVGSAGAMVGADHAASKYSVIRRCIVLVFLTSLFIVPIVVMVSFFKRRRNADR